MNSDEAACWARSGGSEDAVTCVGCGELVHRDFAFENVDGEWSCEYCAGWNRDPLWRV